MTNGPDARPGDPTRRSTTPLARFSLLLCLGLAVSGCAHQEQTATRPSKPTVDPRYGVTASPRVVQEGRTIPRGGGAYRVGRPYTVAGRRYVPYEKRRGHTEVGVASWYGRQFHGRLTANGEVYDMNALSAAHRTMPMPSYARVTNMRNGRSIVVRVNDRGPFAHNRVIDLSSRVSTLLDFKGQGLARVRVEYIGRAGLAGSDDRMLLATLRTDGSPAPDPGQTSGVLVASASPTFAPAQASQPSLTANRAPTAASVQSTPAPPALPATIVAEASGAPMQAPLPMERPAALIAAAADRALSAPALTVVAAQPATRGSAVAHILNPPARAAVVPAPLAPATRAFAPASSAAFASAPQAPGASLAAMPPVAGGGRLGLGNGSLY